MQRRFSLALLAAAALLVLPASAGGATFSNPTPFTMPNAGAAAPAIPYQTAVNVDGLTGAVTDVNVTIKGFSHACISDADLLLAGPGGARTLLLSDAGGYCEPDAVGVTITLDDEATTTYPCNASPSGTFKPTNDPTTNGACAPTADAFPPPAPPGPYPVALSSFDGTSPNGAWSLFVFDESGGDAGMIAGGWTLELASGSCAGQPATVHALVGTAEGDVLTGTPGPDVILGLGGSDRILGLEGEDRICGGRGKDKLFGQKGKDRLLGQKGKDRLRGGGAKDICKGGKGNDSASKCEVEKSI